GDFYCLLGGDLKPATQLQGQFEDIQYKAGKLKGMETTENQVYQALLYELQPDNHRSLNFAITGTDQGRDEAETTYRNLLQHSLNSYNQAVIHYRKLLATRTIISSPDPVFNEGYRWALVGTDRFFVNTPELGNALLAGLGTTARGWDGGHRINGRPGYAWYFGRDAEWSGLALNHYGA
ncbi:MAG: hypothetical protein GWN16_05235, partial [Calditrichae bacterium]|nr:hypothetical protein [Calditrichia bacterium]NIW78888.1 hypothetical protein [Calditrichia bacterium]